MLPPEASQHRSDKALMHELQVQRIELEVQNETLRQVQVALEESRDRYADLYEFAPVGYLTLSRDARIETINQTGAALLGIPRDQMLQRFFMDFVASEDHGRWHQYFHQARKPCGEEAGELKAGELKACELTLIRGNGTPFTANLDGCLTRNSGNTEALRITLTDISEHRQSVAQLHAANVQLKGFAAEQATHLHELAGELARVEQGERDRLYELLHDDMQPLLVAARLSLSSLNERTTQPECRRIASEACAHISQVIQIASRLSLQLSPPLIRERGLNAALDWLRGWVGNNHGLKVDLCSTQKTEDTEPDDPALRLLCFSAVRELLMNVAKHAGTAQVTLTLANVDGKNLRITVADAGCGFEPHTLCQASHGSGLAGIERRLGMFGGSFRIESQTGHGTVATLLAPLRSISPGRRGDRRTRKGEPDAQDTDRR